MRRSFERVTPERDLIFFIVNLLGDNILAFVLIAPIVFKVATR